MLCALLLMSTIVAEPHVEVVTLDGESVSGQLGSWSEGNLSVAGTSLSTNSIHRLIVADAMPIAEAPFVLQLSDGSTIVVDRFSSDGRLAKLTRSDRETSFATDSVKSFRVTPLEDRVRKTWSELLQRDTRDDTFARLRGDSLDHVDCIITAISPERVGVRVGGRDVEVPIEKVFGVIFSSSAGGPSRNANASVVLTDGSRLAVDSISPDADQLQLKLAAGIKIQVPWDSVAEINLAAGRIAMLSDLEPRNVSYRPFGDIYDEYAWQYRRNRNALGERLTVAKRKRSSGLWLHSGTTLSFPLPARASRLQADVGIDELPATGAPVELEILADGRQVFSATIQPDQPKKLDIDITDTRLLTIVANTTNPDGHGIREHLAIVDARLLLE